VAATVSQDVAVEMTGISKTYPGVQALDEVSFCLLTKEIHAIVGANGAGKSTLVKILFGAEQPDCGELRIDGVPRRFLDPAHAQLKVSPMFHKRSRWLNIKTQPTMSIWDRNLGQVYSSSRGRSMHVLKRYLPA